MGGGTRGPGRNLEPSRRRRHRHGRDGATVTGGNPSQFVAAGDLFDWNSPSSPSGKTRCSGRRGKRRPDTVSRVEENLFSYAYPVSPSDQLIDPTSPSPGDAPAAVSFVPLYEYGPGVSALCDGSRRGLGFNADDNGEERLEEVEGGEGGEEEKELKIENVDEEDEGEDQEVEKLEETEVGEGSKVQKNRNKKRNNAFISIGSLRLYTEDVSSPEEDYGDIGASASDESSLCSDEEEEEEEGVLEDDELSLSFEDGSEIDEEVADDYLVGIGGSSVLLEAEWLMKQKMGVHDDDGFSDSDWSSDDYGDEDGDGMLGGVALMNASREYGMRKSKAKKGKVANVDSPDVKSVVDAFDDLMFVKDTRRPSARKKSNTQLSQSWLSEAQRSKKYKNVPGAKKKHRQDQIAKKRRERAINHGVDLDQINARLRKMVLNEVDTLSFQPMHSRDCSQVQRLASIYRLRSGCQGSGKKRFVTVTRTVHTCLPSSSDTLRLGKLLGLVEEDFTISDPRSNSKSKTKTSRKIFFSPESHPSSAPAKLANENGRYKQKKSLVSFAERPVSFVSSGTMQNDSASMVINSSGDKVEEAAQGSSSSKIGAFEVHTKGFGSRMMAKMGYVEGSGLGKDGWGMSVPIEPIQRPKSLGLGVEFSEATVETTVVIPRSVQSGGIGAFEKHTRGFGSKMMTKMGFVPGTGLGKDAQGMTRPLTAVRRPKSRGLGAKS